MIRRRTPRRNRHPGLFKPPDSDVWHYRFMIDGVRRSRSTGETDERKAWDRASEIREDAKREQRDPFAKHRKTPLSNHLEAWRVSMQASGAKPAYVKMTLDRTTRLVNFCGWKRIDDIAVEDVQCFTADLRNRDQRTKKRGFGVRTRNYYIGGVKQFTRWLTENRRAPEDPLRFLKREKGAKGDARHPRRAFTDAELHALFAHLAADEAPIRFGISGVDRKRLYEFAAATGFRANEIKTLAWSALDLDSAEPIATVRASYSKNGDGRTVPLTRSIAARLAACREQRRTADAEDTPERTRPAFVMPQLSNVARMLHDDLDAARAAWIESATDDSEEHTRRERSEFLAYKNDAGEFADFHAFRHTFASALARRGVPVKAAMELLGHKTIAMTLEIYSHVLMPDQRSAVESALTWLENTEGSRDAIARQSA